ncbi:DUF6114 domain-containing protein [Kitasatospora sp. NBC_01266]|uniref:DUF6114 domain-containing protein n=1 Tax=Kitasatospora sp. NBC_01266 TaxID=2903572 RepID=UPI002E36B567|nr:DUF6114 domain-containing protein [Kitasatospora sp. NBC_01266]
MTSATAPLWPDGAGLPTRARLRFRAWRRTRPFWGGLISVVGGVPILYFPYAHLTLSGVTIAMATTAGAGSLVIGLLMIALGVSAWFQPATRVFCGIAVTILSLISIPVSNLGGFGMGLILGLLGGGLLCAWAPLKEPKPVADTAVDPGVAMSVPAQATAAEAVAEPAAETVQLPGQAAAVDQPAVIEQAGDVE